MKQIWDELANYDQIPSCKCGGCTCNLAAEFEKKIEEERVHALLMGLDENIFGTVRSNILVQDPLPNVNRAYSMLIAEERVKTITRTKEERQDVMAFAMRGRGEVRDRSGLYCTHCKRTGHEIDNCFALHGYPDWWGDRPKGNGRSAGRGRGTNSTQQRQNQTGVRRGRETARANSVSSSSTCVTDIGAAGVAAAGNDVKTSLGFNQEQWTSLMKLINGQKNSAEKLSGKLSNWIIDTGASHHMTGSMHGMKRVRDIDPCPVGLPDGSETMATKEGQLVLEENLCLTNVLFIPGLECNLISVSQLVDSSKCIVYFTNSMCVM